MQMPPSPSNKSLSSIVCPIQRDNSEIVLQNDFGEPEPLDYEDFTCTNREAVNLQNAAVNIDNSNDVIIGPVTQFNVTGNVSIFQNGQPASGENSLESSQKLKITDGGRIFEERRSIRYWGEFLRKKVKLPNNKKFIWWSAMTIFFIAVSAITTLVILVNKFNDGDLRDEENYYGHTIGRHRIYYKRDWGGKRRVKTEILPHPVGLVIISHSKTKPCDSFDSCSEKVRAFQNNHLSINMNDIGYNFVIGGDGNVYVGRGWDVKNFHSQVSIGINFVGDFNGVDVLNASMIETAKLLIDQGVGLYKLSPEYVLVGHNQSTRKQPYSPGENVYSEIKTWPHFSDVILFT